MGSYTLTRAFAMAFFSLLPALAETAPIAQASGEVIQSPKDQSVEDNLLGMGRTAFERGDLAQAEKYYSESRAIQRRLAPESPALANSLNGLGDVAEQRGDLPKAEEYYRQALAISRKLGPDRLTAAASLYGFGRVALDRFDFRQAEEYLLPALSIRRKLRPAGIEVAAALNSLGDARRIAENLGEAERYYRQALGIANRSAPNGLISADSLAGLGTVAFFRADFKRAEIYHRRALAIRERTAPHSLAVASSLFWLGTCCGNELASIEAYCRRALAIQEELAPNSLAVSLTLTRLSFLLWVSGDLTTALERQRRALEIEQKLAPDSLLTATSYDQLGRMLDAQDNPESGKQYCLQALGIRKKLKPDSRDVALSLVSLGEITHGVGDLAGAEEYFLQAWALRGKLDFRSKSDLLRGLGSVAHLRGELIKAEGYYRRALVIRQRVQPGSLRVAYSLYELGSLLRDRGQLTLAEIYQQRALRMSEKIAPNSSYVAASLSALGYLADDRGDLARAERYHRRETEIIEKLAPGSFDYAHSLSDLAGVLCRRGELVEGERYYRAALAITEKLVPKSLEHAEVLSGLAGIMRRTERLDDAGQFYEAALSALEAQTARVGGVDDLRSNFRANHARYYTDYVDLLISRNQPELAFQVQERLRARTLLETLAAAHVDPHQGVDIALVKRERSLQQLLAAKSQRRIRIISEEHTDDQVATINRELEDLLDQYTGVQEEIRRTSSAYAALTLPQPMSAKDIQHQFVDAHTVFLEYSLGDEHSFVWVITPDSVTAQILPKRAEVERAATRVYATLTARNHLFGGASRQSNALATEKDYEKKAADLSRMVLAPIAGQLAAKRLLLVSDGALEYIPFAALPEPSTPHFMPLILDHEIVNLPSASVLAALRREAAAREPAANLLAVVADPVFDKEDVRVTRKTNGRASPWTQKESAGASAADRLTRSLSDVSAGPLQRLPFSRLEAEAILGVTPGKNMAALDFQASRATVTSPTLSQYRIVHFATHGVLDSKHPQLSGLILSMVNRQGKPEDGFLDLAEIYNLNLSADLVVLSACETGLGKQIRGEGLVGMTRGFMHAGATGVVASLWNVSDVATAKLMERFYRAMEKQGMSPPAALRNAQIELFKQKRWSFPYYWAAFQIHGEGR